MELIELFKWLKYFREKRARENLSQAELFRQELKLIGMALVGIACLMGFLFALVWFIMKRGS